MTVYASSLHLFKKHLSKHYSNFQCIQKYTEVYRREKIDFLKIIFKSIVNALKSIFFLDHLITSS